MKQKVAQKSAFRPLLFLRFVLLYSTMMSRKVDVIKFFYVGKIMQKVPKGESLDDDDGLMDKFSLNWQHDTRKNDFDLYIDL